MDLLSFIVHGVRMIVFLDVILSWVMRDPSQFPRSITHRITAPLYAPIHAVLNPEKTGGMDFAPLIVLVLLSVLERALL